MSEQQHTPRTDAAAFDLNVIGDACVKRETSEWGDYVETDFARGLEKELAALRTENERLRDALVALTVTLESHDAISYDCDRSGETYCDCLDRVVFKATQALASERKEDAA